MDTLLLLGAVGVVVVVGIVVSSRVRRGLSDEWFSHLNHAESTRGVDLPTSGRRHWNATPLYVPVKLRRIS